MSKAVIWNNGISIGLKLPVKGDHTITKAVKLQLVLLLLVVSTWNSRRTFPK